MAGQACSRASLFKGIDRDMGAGVSRRVLIALCLTLPHANTPKPACPSQCPTQCLEHNRQLNMFTTVKILVTFLLSQNKTQMQNINEPDNHRSKSLLVESLQDSHQNNGPLHSWVWDQMLIYVKGHTQHHIHHLVSFISNSTTQCLDSGFYGLKAHLPVFSFQNAALVSHVLNNYFVARWTLSPSIERPQNPRVLF